MMNTVTGVNAPRSLTVGQHVLIFILPEDCLACDETAVGLSALDLADTRTAYVSSAPPSALSAWAAHVGAEQVLFDPGGRLGFSMRVSEAPTVFMIRDGQVVNTEFWPFHGGLEGLKETLRAFNMGAFNSASASRGIAALKGVDLSSLPVRSSSVGGTESLLDDRWFEERALLVCDAFCPACEDAAHALASLPEQDWATLPTIAVILVLNPSTGAVPRYWASAGVPVYLIDRDEAGALETGTTPTTIVTSREGRVLHAWIGFGSTTVDALRRIAPQMRTGGH